MAQIKPDNALPQLEIRILGQQASGYPVELTLNHSQQFSGGYLSPDLLPWIPSASPQADGERLFDDLFAAAGLRQAWTEIRGQHPRRRIQLRIDDTAPELHAIPWELLSDTTLGHPSQPLAAEADTPFSRYLAGQWTPGAPIAERPLKMLVVIANPINLKAYDLAPIDVVREQEIVEAASTDLTTGQLEMTFLSEPVTLPRLEEVQREGYHLLHIVAHGTFSKKRQRSVLYLADEHNQVKLVRETDFAAMIDRLEQKPELVFLASCQSAARDSADAFRGLGPRLIGVGLPTVLAMQDFVPVETAREFTRIFYRQLFAHGQLDLASNEARSALLTADLSGSSIPVLFSRLPGNQLLAPSVGEAVPVIERKPFEPETILIPAGPFLMGSLTDDSVPASELQQHEVDLAAYRIGKFPVTNEQYAEFIKQTKHPPPRVGGWFGKTPPKQKGDHPVVGVSWYDALAYCQWLSEQTGRAYRLPTEAEWEKAARGTEGRIYPWGDEGDPSRCNCDNSQTTPVAAYPAGRSPYGCYDMVGNVWEWTSTLWGPDWQTSDFDYPYRPDDGREDLSADPTVYRLFRGGDFGDAVTHLRCSARRWYAPDHADKARGFRVALGLKD